MRLVCEFEIDTRLNDGRTRNKDDFS